MCQNNILLVCILPHKVKISRKGKDTTERKIIVHFFIGKYIKEVCSIVSRPRSIVRSISKRFEDTHAQFDVG